MSSAEVAMRVVTGRTLLKVSPGTEILREKSGYEILLIVDGVGGVGADLFLLRAPDSAKKWSSSSWEAVALS